MGTVEHPDCFRCRSFFVTHEAQHPYGCRAFGMKSKDVPARAVFSASGRPCSAFEPKAPLPDTGRPDGAPGRGRSPHG